MNKLYDRFVRRELVVQCKTHAEARAFLKYLVTTHGSVWRSDEDLLDEDKWEDNEEFTCYASDNPRPTCNRVVYCDTEHYNRQGIKIISYHDFFHDDIY